MLQILFSSTMLLCLRGPLRTAIAVLSGWQILHLVVIGSH